MARRDAGEPSVEGGRITLRDAGNVEIGKTFTSADGENLCAGLCWVRIDLDTVALGRRAGPFSREPPVPSGRYDVATPSLSRVARSQRYSRVIPSISVSRWFLRPARIGHM